MGNRRGSGILGIFACLALAACQISPGEAAFQAALSPSFTPTPLPFTNTPPAGFLATPLFGPLIGPAIRALNSRTPTPTPTQTNTPTATPTPTRTATRTPLPTFTATFTSTFTITPTPRPSITLLPTETSAPSRPARLFPFYDLDGTLVDWGYTRISDLSYDKNGKILRLSAFLSFQLLDRGIHRTTVRILDRDLTLYYLNTQHEFDGKVKPVMLILGGAWGMDVPTSAIPGIGSFFIEAITLKPGAPFDPYNIHNQSVKNYASKLEPYQGGVFFPDFERSLATLPDALILAADHPILMPASSNPDIEYYLKNTPFLAARFQPLVTLNPLGMVTGPSPYALSLADTLLKNAPPPEDLLFPSATLVLIPGA